MSKKVFIGILLIISLLGLGLRLVDYDRVPGFTETQDEFFYPWAGMSWLRTGVPTAWSWFPAYPKRDIVTWWGAQYPLVSPWVEKPPLYTLLTGGWMLVSGARELTQVRLVTLRVLPITLGVISIIFCGLLASQLFSPAVGLLAALLYATTPTIVLGNRLSLTENLLTPLALITIWAFFRFERHKNQYLQATLVGLGSLAILLTKNIGIALPIGLGLVYLVRWDWKKLAIVAAFTLIGVIIHPAIGAWFDWKLYQNVMSNYQTEFAGSGLPQLIATIFQYPTPTTKNHLLLDGGMLLGYVLFFTSPWWLIPKYPLAAFFTTHYSKNSLWSRVRKKISRLHLGPEHILLSFPFAYIAILSILASGDKFSFYGWHAFPLYPFLMILLATVVYKLWKVPQFLGYLTCFLILGSSTLRFLLTNAPVELQSQWPTFLLYPLLALVLTSIDARWQRGWWLLFMILVIVGNVYISTQLAAVFPAISQPAL